MVMGKPSVNRGKITSTNSTHPTPKTAKQTPVQRNDRHSEPLSRSDLVLEPKADAVHGALIVATKVVMPKEVQTQVELLLSAVDWRHSNISKAGGFHE